MSNFKIDEKGFWYCENGESHCFDERLCKEISKIFKEQGIESVVDFGCGPGKYVLSFIESGLDCVGFDGNPNTPKYTKGVCKVQDLSEDFDLGKTFECALSLEVGEHIPKQYETIFINNITKHAKSLLICSWAIPGQSGKGHINCQTNEYITSEICSRGFYLDEVLTARLRSISKLPWFKNTLFVFWRSL